MAHEVLVDLFKNRPSLGAELLTEALGVPLPSYTEARLHSVDLTEIRPAEYRADVVILLLDGDRPIYVLIVEVQLGLDERKRFTWPEYTMGSRARHRCPVGLLVVAPDPQVAVWCAEPIETGIPGFVLRPPVLGRASVPVVTDAGEAARRPELAVLSALAHGGGEHGAAIAAAALPTIRGLEDERARFYGDLVLSCLNEAAREALETMMKGYEYQSDFAKKYVAQGRSEGLKEGRSEGLKEGRSEGLKEGREEGERALLLLMMRSRFGELPAAVVTRVEGAPVAQVERWARRVLAAATLADVLDEPS